MNRSLTLAVALLLPVFAHAQETRQMDHSQMNHDAMMQMSSAVRPKEGGQGAFAAIAEIVALLDADPATDWARVDIEALRQHLIDMDNVTLRAQVAVEGSDTAVAYLVTSKDPAVQASIRRMVEAHAVAMSGTKELSLSATEIQGGSRLVISAPTEAMPRIKALGFIGVMTFGMHHQAHHLALASGQNPHP